MINEIQLGDCRELAKAIPDHSVDLAVLDPPYLEQYLHLYRWFSLEGARILKPGSFAYIYASVYHIREHYKMLDVEGGLSWFWTDVLLHNGGYPRVWSKKKMSGYKPILVYTNGKPDLDFVKWSSSVHTDSQDKNWHKWGQGEGFAMKIIDMFCPPDGTVWDPFCGGGTTAVAAKRLGRNFITSEIDPEAYEQAKRRIESVDLVLKPTYLMQSIFEENNHE